MLDPRVDEAIKKYGVVTEVLECKPEWADTAVFCEQYGISPELSANTILVASRKVEPTVYAACVVLAPDRLDVNKAVRKLLGVKKLSFASSEQTLELSGMMIGGVTAVGLPDSLPIYVDKKVMEAQYVIMGGGNRSSKLKLDPNELRKLPNVEVIDDLSLPRS